MTSPCEATSTVAVGMARAQLLDAVHRPLLHIDERFATGRTGAAAALVPGTPLRVAFQAGELAAHPLAEVDLVERRRDLHLQPPPRGQRRDGLHGARLRAAVDGMEGPAFQPVGQCLGLQPALRIERHATEPAGHAAAQPVVRAVAHEQEGGHASAARLAATADVVAAAAPCAGA